MNDNDKSSKVFFENMGKNLAASGNGLNWKDVVLFPVLIVKFINNGWNKYKEDKIAEVKQYDEDN
jgi:hypothetical protein